MYKCCIFDLDGTLINSIKAIAYSCNLTLKKYNLGPIDEDTYKIVGSAEADAFNNLISNVSPLGQALMSHKEGDIVTVESPNGQYSVKILKVC